MMNPKGISLIELNRRISEVVRNSFQGDLWVIGEISELKISSSGHCYLEIIEKDPESDSIIARQRANIWAYSYRMLSGYFRSTTGYNLEAGLKILVNVQVEFHEAYGLSLTVKDIDPTYTLGDLAKRKREIILRLQKEGVIDMNRNLPFPLVPQRIAVISSSAAAGWGDFQDSLKNNAFGFLFEAELFQAFMQGEKAEESIVYALDRVFEREKEFDIVVIIRGGGATADMECFNNYNLVYHITQFPLPVVTGIGHEKDETIADIVACRSLKTPTAVAEFLVDAMTSFYELILSCHDRLSDAVLSMIHTESQRLASFSQSLNFMVMKTLHNHFTMMHSLHQRLLYVLREFGNRGKETLRYFLYRARLHTGHRMNLWSSSLAGHESLLRQKIKLSLTLNENKIATYEKSLLYLNPLHVLKRGYSITSFKDKIIKGPEELTPGDKIMTRFFKGSIRSEVIQNEKKMTGKDKE